MLKNGKPLNESIIRRSYESAIENAARLYSYHAASLEKTVFSSDISYVLQELAHRDLLSFAISTRRLIEATKLVAVAKENQISSLRLVADKHDLSFVKSETSSFWSVMNYIIHSEEIDFYYDSIITLYAFGHFKEDKFFEAISHGLGKKFSPIFYVKTDQKKPKLFSVFDVVSCFDSLAEKIVEKCADNKIHISSLHDD